MISTGRRLVVPGHVCRAWGWWPINQSPIAFQGGCQLGASGMGVPMTSLLMRTIISGLCLPSPSKLYATLISVAYKGQNKKIAISGLFWPSKPGYATTPLGSKGLDWSLGSLEVAHYEGLRLGWPLNRAREARNTKRSDYQWIPPKLRSFDYRSVLVHAKYMQSKTASCFFGCWYAMQSTFGARLAPELKKNMTKYS